MAISLTISVVDITATLALGYTHINVYRSIEQASGFAEITTATTRLSLVAGVSAYTFIDGSGTTEHWYATTFSDTTEVITESSMGTAFHGSFFDTNFSPITYPEEAVFTLDDHYIIDRLRNLTGDPKQLTRDYVSVDTGYSSISLDGTTHTLSNPNGWPLRIVLDDIEHISKDEPRVNDFQFVTFSGIIISTVSGTLDIWYYHFRTSDAELLRVFNGLIPPPQLTVAQVPLELSLLCAAIEVLEGELRQFGVTSGSQISIFQEISINPKGGFDGRLKDLENLRKRKNSLLAEILDELGGVNKDICGVLID